MQKTLDLNEFSRPVLLLTMMDEAHTKVHITTPTVALKDELSAKIPELQKLFAGTGPETTRGIYDLAARLINCNLDYIKVTGDELATKYCMSIESMIIFFNSYVDFIDAVQNAKN